MRKNIHLLILLFFIMSCSTVSRVQFPSGKTGYLVKCPFGVSDCIKMSSEVCPNGWGFVTQKAGFYGSAWMKRGKIYCRR